MTDGQEVKVLIIICHPHLGLHFRKTGVHRKHSKKIFRHICFGPRMIRFYSIDDNWGRCLLYPQLISLVFLLGGEGIANKKEG